MTNAEKAIERGRKDFLAGNTRNPYHWIGQKHQMLAAWWDKGYNEAKRKSEKAPEES